MVTLESLRHHKPAIDRLAIKYGARSIRVFGSVARGSPGSDSDIDFLVEFDANRTLFDLIGLRLDLRDLLAVDVDIVTPDSLLYIRDKVLAEARAI
jgi:predicted nucleotidyltransferase